MAKNDSILIDGIIARRVADVLPSADVGEVFEYFCFEQILKSYDLSQDEIEVGWVDGRHDGGVDGFFVFVNGHQVSDVATFPWPRSHARLDIFIISCKHHDTFKEATVNSVLASVQELLDLSSNDVDLKGAYSKEVLNARGRLAEAYKKLAITSPEMNLTFVYASRGDTEEVGESVRARSAQIEHAAAAAFSNINVNFRFFGAKELIARYRETKQFALEMPFQDYLTGTGEGYIAVVRLGDYYRFVCDESGNLRRYLFDSNVRDYLGDNKVNEDISASLDDELVPDFWWLNNGITILATKAAINGKNILMQDIQVVNGLQTTETIFRHFSSGRRASANAALSIKIVVSKDEKLRDQIIRATNNQSAVEQASLHATDKIQRDIEQILERYDFYYERRKNYYRNIGRPVARFVTPLYAAGGFVAIVLKDPAAAANLRSRFMRKQSSYEKVFSENTPIEVWPKVVAILKAAEAEMLAAPRGQSKYGDRFLKSWRGLIGLLYAAKSLGTFGFGPGELGHQLGDIDKQRMEECRQFADARRFGLRPSRMLVKSVCREFAETHSLAEVECVERRSVDASLRSRLEPRLLTPDFVESVDSLLPEQPWVRGIHIEVADKLGVPPKDVSHAIRLLMADGRRLNQVDGELFDNGGKKIVPFNEMS